jgi:hypothetical protein
MYHGIARGQLAAKNKGACEPATHPLKYLETAWPKSLYLFVPIYAKL